MTHNIEELTTLLTTIKDSGTLVVVEGQRDASALAALGITHTATLSRKPLFQIAEEIAANHREVVLLTDLDKAGRELYGRLYSCLTALGVRVDNRLREFLMKNTELRQIEGLVSYLEKNRLFLE